MSFLDNISDFYHWMAQFDEVNARSRTNYISWLKFLSNIYAIDERISDESINEIARYYLDNPQFQAFVNQRVFNSAYTRVSQNQ